MLADDVVAQALLTSRNRVLESALAALAALAARGARGEARGRAGMVLRLLARRGVPVDDAARPGGLLPRGGGCERAVRARDRGRRRRRRSRPAYPAVARRR